MMDAAAQMHAELEATELAQVHSIELELVELEAPRRWGVYVRGRDANHEMRDVYVEALPGLFVFDAIGAALDAYHRVLFP